MKLSQIKRSWTHPVHDHHANVAAWDMMAERYTDNTPLPTWDGHPFLRQLKDEVQLTKDMSVLDIGCGNGAYSIVIAEKVGKVVGIDLSPKMLAHAETSAKKAGISNTTFLLADFNDVILEDKFDLVFAHMTPAVADAVAFEKMLSCAAKYCYLVKPVHRTDSVLGELRNISGSPPRPDSFEKGMLYAFSWLWQIGKLPTLGYHPEIWETGKSLEEAKSWYLNRLKTYSPIDEVTEAEVIEYLGKIAVEGKVYETVHTTIATMGWRMDEEES